MKDYKLHSVSVVLDGNTFMEKEVAKQIPTNLINNTDVMLLPTVAYNILLEQIKKGNDNYYYVNGFLNIVRTLYKFDKSELHHSELKQYHSKYKDIIKLLKPIILFYEMPQFNEELNVKESCAIYTMRSYNDLTFITLKEENDFGVIDMNFDFDNLKGTPLDNDSFINTLYKTKIDATSAVYAEYQFINSDEFLNSSDSKDRYKVFMHRVNAILNFLSERKAGKAIKVDRVFSSFSSLSKIARKYLTMNNKPFIEIDIKNCQPLLLCILAKENRLDLDIDYVNDVKNGKFYERLMQEAKNLNYVSESIYDKTLMVNDYYEGHILGKKKFTKVITKYFNRREDVKVLCYNDIFFANKHKNTKLVKVFKSLYPKTYQTILTLAEGQTLAISMQNLEADLVLNIIPNSPYFTVHDAIYLTRTTEVENTKNAISFSIYNRSGGLIDKVIFGDIVDNKIEIIDENNIQLEILNIKARAIHSAKDVRFNQFKELYKRMDMNSLMDELKITRATYFRYKKQLNK